mgnify:CR=1 FL=1
MTAQSETKTWHAVVGRMRALDASAMTYVQRLQHPLLTRFMRALTRFGNASGWFLVGIALLAAGGKAATYAALLGAAATLATVASQVLKRRCRRPRPSVSHPGLHCLVEHPDEFSFPSGHTAAAFAVAIALLGTGVFLGAAAASFAFAVGASRLYLGAHYPLDVMAGALLGMFCGLLVRLSAGLF